jgi:putative membrane protein
MSNLTTKIGCAVAIGALGLMSGVAADAYKTNGSHEPSHQSTASQSTTKSQTSMKPVSDKAFARKAAEGGMAEVKLGQLAQDKGQSEAVKDFGKRMVQDHSQANDQLKQAVSSKNIALPEQLSAKDQATYDQLSKLDGAAFDRAYARDMVEDHRMDIAEFKQEAANGKDESIKGFASQTLPTLEDHLKLARQMMQSVSSSTSKSGSGGSR